jgi:formylglycine-generating enzyme required for sulfatase activity
VTGYHDLWRGNLNAPGLLREVEGDFTVDTKLAGPGRWCGGILVWKDPNNYIRFERGPHFRNELNLEVNSTGAYSTVAQDYVEGDPIWLRFARNGTTFGAAYSLDGKTWLPLKRLLISHKPVPNPTAEDPESVLKEGDFTFKAAKSAVEMSASGPLLVGVSGILPLENGRPLMKQTVTDYDYIEIRESASAAFPKLAAPVVPPATIAAGTKKVNPKDGLTYVWIPPGRFMMGCSLGDAECDGDERPAHEVTITKGFWLGQTPVTQQAYQRVTGQNPIPFIGANLPVESVYWDEAKAYCAAVGGRLPTEAEWEYAARAGSTNARYGNLDDIAWYWGNSGNKPHDVAQKIPNAFGLYDMLGNVHQWVADLYGIYQAGAQIDPSGAESGQSRTLRGGPYYRIYRGVRVSSRNKETRTEARLDGIGVRCVWE